jgi:hypothetical protein
MRETRGNGTAVARHMWVSIHANVLGHWGRKSRGEKAYKGRDWEDEDWRTSQALAQTIPMLKT